MNETKRDVTLHFELCSAATFGRGDGLPGLVDSEVEHDAYGFPFLRGRTLRGLLAEEMESLLYALGKQEEWKDTRNRLLGDEARLLDETGVLRVGHAQLPEAVRCLVMAEVEREKEVRRKEKEAKKPPEEMTPLWFTREAVLDSVTAVRRQTALTHLGAPEPASLRAQRVILRTTRFEAQLDFDEEPQPLDLPLLTATVMAWRRAGTGRNRGRGRLRAWLNDEAWTKARFTEFVDFCQGRKKA